MTSRCAAADRASRSNGNPSTNATAASVGAGARATVGALVRGEALVRLTRTLTLRPLAKRTNVLAVAVHDTVASREERKGNAAPSLQATRCPREE